MKTKFAASCAVVLLLTVSPFLRAEDPAPSPDTATVEGHALRVLGASYNWGHNWADVTERVKGLLRGQVSFTISPTWLGVDPHPGWNKDLDISCEIDGKFAMLTMEENEDISRPIILRKARTVTTTSDPLIAPPTEEAENAVNEDAEDHDNYPTLTTPVDEHGAPLMQTVRINREAEVHPGAHTSGFRFKVDRTEAAAKQHVDDKTKMDLFWTFVMPHGVNSWFIEPVKGRMRGFSNYYPIKPSAIKNSDTLLPADKKYITIQRLGAEKFKEGEEYIIWFACSEKAAAPIEMSVSLGYRLDARTFVHWDDLTEVAKFLGLVPAGEKVGVDERAF